MVNSIRELLQTLKHQIPIEILVNNITFYEHRVFSVANADPNSVELIISTRNPGPATTYMKSIEIGKEIVYRFVEGVYKETDPSIPTILIGMGSGIALVMSIYKWKETKRKRITRLLRPSRSSGYRETHRGGVR